jgi:carbon storage regulator
VLVLTRRAGESIVIGDDVRVVVLDVRGDTVRLGIEAPRSVQVHRAEVYAEVQAANAAAAHAGTDLGSVADRLQRVARPRPPGRGPRPGPAHGPTPAPEPGAQPTPGVQPEPVDPPAKPAP